MTRILLGTFLIGLVGCASGDDTPVESGAGAPLTPLGAAPSVVRHETLRGSEVRGIRLVARAVYARRVIADRARIGVRYEGGAQPPWATPGEAPIVGNELEADVVIADTVWVSELDADEVHARKLELGGVTAPE